MKMDEQQFEVLVELIEAKARELVAERFNQHESSDDAQEKAYMLLVENGEP